MVLFVLCTGGWLLHLCIHLISGIRSKVGDGWGWRKVQYLIYMVDYDEGFVDKETIIEYEVMRGMDNAVGACTTDQ